MSSDFGDPLGRIARRQEVIRRLADREPGGGHPDQDIVLRDVVEAVRPVLDRHPTLVLTVTVQQPDGGATIQLSRLGDEVHVSVARHGGTLPVPDPAGDEAATSEAAARIARLLRENPHLLDRPLGGE